MNTSKAAMEVARLRGILWDIIGLTGDDRGASKHPPAPGRHDPDIPEWALQAVDRLRGDYVDYTGESVAAIHSRALNSGTWADDVCGCGWPITWYQDQWTHVFNTRLTGNRDCEPEPRTGYYEPHPPSPEIRLRRRNVQPDLADNMPASPPAAYVAENSDGTYTFMPSITYTTVPPVTIEERVPTSAGSTSAEEVNRMLRFVQNRLDRRYRDGDDA